VGVTKPVGVAQSPNAPSSCELVVQSCWFNFQYISANAFHFHAWPQTNRVSWISQFAVGLEKQKLSFSNDPSNDCWNWRRPASKMETSCGTFWSIFRGSCLLGLSFNAWDQIGRNVSDIKLAWR